MSATLELTQDLIARNSVTPVDAGCQQVMGDRLAALGFQVESLRYGNVENLWATRGSGTPTICFAGHTDVVPTGPLEEWRSDPFKPVIKDGMLFGRGAADMKSGLAAMITATEEFVRAHPNHRGRIAFLITSDEEGPSVDGTKRVVETLRERGDVDHSRSALWSPAHSATTAAGGGVTSGQPRPSSSMPACTRHCSSSLARLESTLGLVSMA